MHQSYTSKFLYFYSNPTLNVYTSKYIIRIAVTNMGVWFGLFIIRIRMCVCLVKKNMLVLKMDGLKQMYNLMSIWVKLHDVIHIDDEDKNRSEILCNDSFLVLRFKRLPIIVNRHCYSKRLEVKTLVFIKWEMRRLGCVVRSLKDEWNFRQYDSRVCYHRFEADVQFDEHLRDKKDIYPH